MKQKNLILTTEDHKLLTTYLNGVSGRTALDRRNLEDLRGEIKKAKVVSSANIPLDIVRLNSKVALQAEGESKVMNVELVTPENANVSEQKISIFAPIGTALIGFRQGQQINWEVPAGKKTFTILEVVNG